MSASPRLQPTEAHWWDELFSSFSFVRAHCMPVWATLIQSLDQANPWNQQLVAHFGERTARWECNKGFSLPSVPGDHHSGRVIVGTQSLTFRLSSQNKFSFSRAGSFQPSSFGFCKKVKSCTPWVLPASWGHHNIYRSISLELKALPDSFCPDTDKTGSSDAALADSGGNPVTRSSAFSSSCYYSADSLRAKRPICAQPRTRPPAAGAGAAPAGSGSAGHSRHGRGDCARRSQDTHRDEDAVQIPRLPGVLAGPHDGRQLGHVVHPHDVDVVLAAEGLDQSEVDLQGDVPLVLLVRGQHAERDVVGVAARREAASWDPRSAPAAPQPHRADLHAPPYPHRPTYTFISLADS